MNSTDSSMAWGVLDDHVYKMLAGAAVVLLVIGAVAYRLLEEWSWVDSIYFSVVAAAPVLVERIGPSTDASKIFTVFYVLTGISIVTAYLHARLGRRGSRRIQA